MEKNIQEAISLMEEAAKSLNTAKRKLSQAKRLLLLRHVPNLPYDMPGNMDAYVIGYLEDSITKVDEYITELNSL